MNTRFKTVSAALLAALAEADNAINRIKGLSARSTAAY